MLAAAKSRQDFTANVSHELKTPLTAISGYAELIENGMVEKEQQIHFATEIRRNAQRLLSLINDIIKLSELDYSEAQQGFEQLDLYGLVKDCMENLQVNAEQRKVALNLTALTVWYEATGSFSRSSLRISARMLSATTMRAAL